MAKSLQSLLKKTVPNRTEPNYESDQEETLTWPNDKLAVGTIDIGVVVGGGSGFNVSCAGHKT